MGGRGLDILAVAAAGAAPRAVRPPEPVLALRAVGARPVPEGVVLALADPGGTALGVIEALGRAHRHRARRLARQPVPPGVALALPRVPVALPPHRGAAGVPGGVADQLLRGAGHEGALAVALEAPDAVVALAAEAGGGAVVAADGAGQAVPARGAGVAVLSLAAGVRPADLRRGAWRVVGV